MPDDREPLAELRPRFVLWTSFLQQLPLQVFIAIWAGLFFGGVFVSATRSPGASSGAAAWSPSYVIGFIVFFVLPVVLLASKWLNYRNTRYRIHPEHVDIDEGFFTIHAKRILLREVRETSLRRGILQRLAGLGSVYLATQATGSGWKWSPSALLGSSSTFGSGAMLMDLADSAAVYDRLRTLADAAQADRAHGGGSGADALPRSSARGS